MRRRICTAALIAAAMAAQSYAAGPDFLQMLLKKPEPALLTAEQPREEREEQSGHDEILRWERLMLLDEHGRFNPRGLYEANLHRRAHTPPKHGHGGLGVSGLSLKVAPETLYWYNWVSRGPNNQGGRTRALLVSPSNAQVMYAGAATGGVWVTGNGGTTWTPLTDLWANTSISSLAFDAGTNTSVIYAGTGESPYSFQEAMYGVGVLKSTDGGFNWSSLTATVGWSPVHCLVAQPNVPGVLLAGTDDGIYRTTNGGTTWTKIYPQGALSMLVFSMQFDPSGNNVIATGRGDFSQSYAPMALYSTNAGLTFNAATTPVFGSGFNMIYAAYAASSPSIVYLHRPGFDVLKSVDGGHTYSALPNLTTQICVQYDTCAIWVSRTNPNLLVIGGLDLWRSIDGGNSFTRISTWYYATPGGPEPHADQHVMVSDPVNSSVVYFGNDGGVFKTIDITQVYSQSNYWVNLNRTYQTTQFYNAAGNATYPGTYFGGTQDNGSLVTSPQAGGSPYHPGNDALQPIGGDGGWAAIDPVNFFYLYGETQSLQNCQNCPFSPQPYRSNTWGTSSMWIGSGLNEVSDPTTNPYPGANFIPPLIMDPNNRATLLAGGARLWRTPNANDTTFSPSWSPIRNGSSPLLNSNFLPYISAIAVAPGNSNIIWVGLDDGRVDKTVNGGASWNWVDNGSFPNPLPQRYVTSIYIDPANSNVAYVTFGGYASDNIYRTADGGNSWTNIHGNLPPMPIRTIVRHPRNPQQLYVGGDVGAYTSADGGVSWITTEEGPADVQVTSLSFSSNSTEELMAATHGRGMWTADTSDVQTLAPSGLTATANGTSSVTLYWTGAAGASSYSVWRSNDGGAYSQVGTAGLTTYTDGNVVPGKSYLYKVNTTINSVPTLYTNVDLATTVTFTDDNTLAGKKPLATHLQEIRNAVNMVRAAAGLSPLTFSPAAAPNVVIAASDITALRTGLNAAYTSIGMPSPPTFTNFVGYGELVRALDYQEIRNAVK